MYSLFLFSQKFQYIIFFCTLPAPPMTLSINNYILLFEYQMTLERIWVWTLFWVFQEHKGDVIILWLWLIDSLRWLTLCHATGLIMLLTLLIFILRRPSRFREYQEVLYVIEHQIPISFVRVLMKIIRNQAFV